jgi:hypothetical protein
VQVSADVQWATGVHEVQAVCGAVLSAQYPDAHCVHCDVVALRQVNGLRQWGTGVHIGHVSGVVAEPSLR